MAVSGWGRVRPLKATEVVLGRGAGFAACGRYVIDRRMEDTISPGLLDERDGLNPTRALILEGYYALRRTRVARHIGCRDISIWIKEHEPTEALPSDSLIRLTLVHARVAHRAPGRPRHDGPAKRPGPPFLPARQRVLPDPARR